MEIEIKSVTAEMRLKLLEKLASGNKIVKQNKYIIFYVIGGIILVAGITALVVIQNIPEKPSGNSQVPVPGSIVPNAQDNLKPPVVIVQNKQEGAKEEVVIGHNKSDIPTP
jgi:hypothetical protein